MQEVEVRLASPTDGEAVGLLVFELLEELASPVKARDRSHRSISFDHYAFLESVHWYRQRRSDTSFSRRQRTVPKTDLCPTPTELSASRDLGPRSSPCSLPVHEGLSRQGGPCLLPASAPVVHEASHRRHTNANGFY